MPYKRRAAMRKTVVTGLLGVMITVAAGNVAATVAGSTTTLGVAATEMTTLTKGWSAKKQILDKSVYNDQNEKVGEVEDIIVAPDKSISYAIVGVGGFLGLGEHYVTIPFNQLKADEGKFMLRGATKEALKALPKFDYAKAK
jgi:sporulation protein YlmC with PRC-barrel domain